jgi:hypothetical protein
LLLLDILTHRNIVAGKIQQHFGYFNFLNSLFSENHLFNLRANAADQQRGFLRRPN